RQALLVPEFRQQPHGTPQRSAPGEDIGGLHARQATLSLMSSAARKPLASVLMLCWRDVGHPQGGGSETYLQRIGAQLAADGVSVTLRTAHYDGAPRDEVIDGVRISRGGGRYTVYVWALLAMIGARLGMGPLREVRPDVIIDTQNGWPFFA